jgi:predicted TIM-barrel fold metal-dependent hydrolase
MIDHHVHLGKDLHTGFSLSREDLFSRMDEYEVSGSVIFSCPGQEVKKNPYALENEAILQAASEDSRLIPFMFIHPFLDEISYVEDISSEFRGFKLHPSVEGMKYDYKNLEDSDVAKFLISVEKPILFHTGYRSEARINSLEWMTRNSPGQIIYAHCGDLIDEDLQRASNFENVYLDVSPMASMLNCGFFIEAKKRSEKIADLEVPIILNYLGSLFGKERILWGSDSPWCDNLHPNGYSSEVQIGRIMKSNGFNKTLFNQNDN